jgi:hypothetical protein
VNCYCCLWRKVAAASMLEAIRWEKKMKDNCCRVSLIYLQFPDPHFGVLLLWCILGFSRLLIVPIFVLMHFSIFRFKGKRSK